MPYRISRRRSPRTRTEVCIINWQELTRRTDKPVSPRTCLRSIRRGKVPPLRHQQSPSVRWRSHRLRKILDVRLFRGLVNFEHLIRCDVSQNLTDAAGPTNLDSLNLFDCAGSEMHSLRTGRRVADGRGDLIPLVAEPNHRAYSIAVTSCTDELEDQPVVRI